ncbi:MAG: hypothetical protein ACE366_26915 [Bradymonadia bacterium]
MRTRYLKSIRHLYVLALTVMWGCETGDTPARVFTDAAPIPDGAPSSNSDAGTRYEAVEVPDEVEGEIPEAVHGPDETPPAEEGPIDEDPVDADPIDEDPIDEEPIAEAPGEGAPNGEGSAAEEPAAEPPVEHPGEEQPDAQQPEAEAPGAGAPAAPAPVIRMRNVVAECEGPWGSVVRLNACGSEGEVLTYRWLSDVPLAPRCDPEGVFPLGAHALTLEITDVHGRVSAARVEVVVEDTTPPHVELVRLAQEDDDRWRWCHRPRQFEVLDIGEGDLCGAEITHRWRVNGVPVLEDSRRLTFEDIEAGLHGEAGLHNVVAEVCDAHGNCAQPLIVAGERRPVSGDGFFYDEPGRLVVDHARGALGQERVRITLEYIDPLTDICNDPISWGEALASYVQVGPLEFQAPRGHFEDRASWGVDRAVYASTALRGRPFPELGATWRLPAADGILDSGLWRGRQRVTQPPEGFVPGQPFTVWLNGVEIPPADAQLDAEADTVSTQLNHLSSIALAARINAMSDLTGVVAWPMPTVVPIIDEPEAVRRLDHIRFFSINQVGSPELVVQPGGAELYRQLHAAGREHGIAIGDLPGVGRVIQADDGRNVAILCREQGCERAGMHTTAKFHGAVYAGEVMLWSAEAFHLRIADQDQRLVHDDMVHPTAWSGPAVRHGGPVSEALIVDETRRIGGPELTEQNLSINGISIGIPGVVQDIINGGTESEAPWKAYMINEHADETGVIAQPTPARWHRPVQRIRRGTLAGREYIYINDVELPEVDFEAGDATGALVEAFNSVSNASGVVATIVDGVFELTTPAGEDINIRSSFPEWRGNAKGGIELSSGATFVVEGELSTIGWPGRRVIVPWPEDGADHDALWTIEHTGDMFVFTHREPLPEPLRTLDRDQLRINIDGFLFDWEWWF